LERGKARGRPKFDGSVEKSRIHNEGGFELTRVSLGKRTAVGIFAAAVMLVPSAAFAQGNNPTPQQRGLTLASPGVVFIATSVDLSVKADLLVEGGRRISQRYSFPYAFGSGFAVTPDGAVITASHVVEPNQADIYNRGANEVFADLLETVGFTAEADSFRQSIAQDPYIRYDVTALGLSTFAQQEYNACFQGRNCDFNITPNIEVFNAVTIAGQDVTTGSVAEVRASTGFDDTDVALIDFEATNQPTVPLAESIANLQSGTEVVALGFGGSTTALPEGLTEPQKLFGQVSNVRSEGTSQLVEVDIDAETGFSGGPVVNNEGQAVGLVSFGLPTSSGTEAQTYLRTVDDIRAVLASAGVQANRGPVDTNFQEALELYWGNHFSAAIPRFQSVLNLNQGHPMAQQFLSDAQSKKGTAQDIPVEEAGGGLPLIPIIIGVAVLLLLLLIWLFLASRRKKAPTAAAPPGYAAVPPAGFGAPAAQPPAAQPPAAQPPAAQPPAAQPPAAPTQARPPAAQPPAGVGAGQAAEERRPVGFQGQPPAGETTASQQPSSGEAPPPPGIGTAKFCSNCGMENASDATYCARCGHTIS